MLVPLTSSRKCMSGGEYSGGQQNFKWTLRRGREGGGLTKTSN